MSSKYLSSNKKKAWRLSDDARPHTRFQFMSSAQSHTQPFPKAFRKQVGVGVLVTQPRLLATQNIHFHFIQP